MAGESIAATGIHRFWKAGNGWTMARDLKPGDRIRALDLEGIEIGSDAFVHIVVEQLLLWGQLGWRNERQTHLVLVV